MRIHRLKVVLIAASILALGAGVFAGMAVSRLPASNALLSVPSLDRISVADELQLSPDQRDQMRNIWEGVRYNVHATFDRAQSIQKQRDAAVVAMLSDSQKARYAALTQQAAEQFASLNSQREEAFHDGVDQTRKILNDAQRKTYDRIIQERVGTSAATGNGSTVSTTEPAAR